MARKKFDDDPDSDLVDEIDKRLGRTSGMLSVDYWLPTGCDLLDWSLGGGLPGGRMTEMIGGEGVGKSLLALSAAKQTIRAGGRVVYLDEESSVTPERCRDLGVPADDEKQFLVRSPDSLEECLDVIERVCLKTRNLPTPTLIVLDSVAAAIASESGMDGKKNMVKDLPQIGAEARLLSWFFKRGVMRLINGTQVVLLLLNQTRDKIGGYGFGADTETTPGGRALRFYASVRVKVARLKMMKPAKEGAKPAGAFLVARVIKNKVAQPYLTADFPIFFKTGVDNALGLIYFLEQQKAVVIPSAGCVTWDGKKYTRVALRTEMRNNADVYESVRKLAKEAFYRGDA